MTLQASPGGESVGKEEAETQTPKARFDALKRRLSRAMGGAIRDFDMLAEGDRVMCAVSGGKDSYTMHELLIELMHRSPVRFTVIAVNIDQGHPGYPGHLLTEYMARGGHDFRMVAEDTYSIVTEKIPEGKTYCSLCSRLRRGILYRLAQEMGCNKIALGHHRDDALATLMLNLVFSGQLKAMPPKLMADDGANIVIRPLIFATEADIIEYSEARAFPILPCDLCGSQENLQRKQMQNLLNDLGRKYPGAGASMLAALRNVRPSHLFDKKLWAQLDLGVSKGMPIEDSPVATEDDPSIDLASRSPTDVIPIERLLRSSSSSTS
jgi:tRNA 2-thiocytidine biosynthesis protein TtcA